MDEAIDALIFQETRELVLVSTYTIIVSCRWIFTLKYCPDRSVNRYKVRLVAKGYT